MDRSRRTTGQAVETAVAVYLQGPICFKRHVGKDSGQPKLGPKFRMDEKVVAANPAQPGQKAHFFMGEMGLLVLPIHNLRRRDRKRPETPISDEYGQEEGCPVKKKVELAVVMEIEGCRMVVDIGEDCVQDPLAD